MFEARAIRALVATMQIPDSRLQLRMPMPMQCSGIQKIHTIKQAWKSPLTPSSSPLIPHPSHCAAAPVHVFRAPYHILLTRQNASHEPIPIPLLPPSLTPSSLPRPAPPATQPPPHRDMGLRAQNIVSSSRKNSPTSAWWNTMMPAGSSLRVSMVDRAVTPKPWGC
jgi:hypothetical protein